MHLRIPICTNVLRSRHPVSRAITGRPRSPRSARLRPVLKTSRSFEQSLNFGTPSRIVSLEWGENVARIGRTLFYLLETASRLLDSVGRRVANGHRLKRHVPSRA